MPLIEMPTKMCPQCGAEVPLRIGHTEYYGHGVEFQVPEPFFECDCRWYEELKPESLTTVYAEFWAAVKPTWEKEFYIGETEVARLNNTRTSEAGAS